MTETEKPVNPLERRENIGIADGSDHSGEHVTSSRHGIAPDTTLPKKPGSTGAENTGAGSAVSDDAAPKPSDPEKGII